MTNPFIINFAFWAGALTGALMMAFESALDSEGKEKRWGRPQQKKETEK